MEDPHDRLAENGLRLDLGCGTTKVDPSFVGVDTLPAPGVDVVGDVLEVLRAIGDDRVEEIYASHLLEHLPDLAAVVDEIERVLRVGGRLRVVAPHFSNPYYWSDPTHVRPFGLYTFSYLAEDPLFRRRVPTYGRELRLRIVSARLGFRSPAEFHARGVVKRTLGRLLDSRPWTRELYEEYLTGFIGCFEVTWVLEKVR